MADSNAETIRDDSASVNGGIFASGDMTGVMTFNLRFAAEGDKNERSWEQRRPLVSDIIREYRPPILGTQEGLHHQIEDLKADLPNYRAVGVGRDGGDKGEYSAIFYDADRVEAVNSGDFWLSDTPDRPGSKMEGTSHTRMATWCELKVDGAERSTYVFNTHMALEEDVALKQADVLLKKIKEIAPDEDAEIILMGDLNAKIGSPLWKVFEDAGLANAWELSGHKNGPDFSFHDWKGEAETSVREAAARSGFIDGIFYRNGNGPLPPKEKLLVNTIAPERGEMLASDHFPICFGTLGNAQETVKSTFNDRNTPLNPGDPVRVKAAVTNNGGRGIVPIALKVDGETTETKWIVLDEGKKRDIGFETALYASGEHRVGVNDLTPDTVTIRNTPARMDCTYLSVEPYVRPGEEMTVQAIIRNQGGAHGVDNVTLKVDGKDVATNRLPIPAGEKRDTEFSHVFDRPGAYTITVGEQEREINVANELGAEWRFAKDDDPARAAPDFEDSAWQQVDLPAPWEQHSGYTEDNVFGWYRSGVTIPKEWEGRPVRILLGKIDDADQTFFNGHQIGSGGRMPGDEGGYESAATTMRSYTIPPECINYGQKNSLSVRVFDALGDGGIAKGPLGILPLGKAKDMPKGAWQDRVEKTEIPAGPESGKPQSMRF